MKDAERLERLFKGKALKTYRAAMLLVAANPNSAANRIYYCLYQALIGEYERLGMRPETIDAGSAQAAAGDIRLKWTHSFVKNNASLAGLTARECQAVRNAYAMRVVADYQEEDVKPELVKDLLMQAQGILEGLGVPIGA